MNSDDNYSADCCMRPAAPLVEAISGRLNNTRQSRSALFSASVCVALAVGLHLDSSHGFIQTMAYLYPFVKYIAIGMTIALLGFAVISFIVYVRLVWNCPVFTITPRERMLFGVTREAQCFKVEASPLQKPDGSCIETPGPKYSPSGYSPPGRASYSCPSPGGILGTTIYSPSQSPFSYSPPPPNFSPPHLQSSMGVPSPAGGFTPSPLGRVVGTNIHPVDASPTSRYGNYSPSSGGKSYSSGDYQSRGVQNVASSDYQGRGPNGTMSMNNSFSASLPLRSDGSPYASHDPLDSIIGLRSRTGSASPRTPPIRSDEIIRTKTDLQDFLRDVNNKEIRNQQVASAEMSRNSGGVAHSFWSYNRNRSGTSSLRKYCYQSASRSPQSPATVSSCGGKDGGGGGANDEPSTSPNGPDMWASLGVCLEDVDRWVENLRKWISQTILARVMNEINEVNRSLAGAGSEDVQIGEVSLATLKQVAQTKAQLVPRLEALIPFLDVTNNQEYLVQRLRDLSRSGCMSAFKWNAGGEFKGKPWEENLPTDSAILIHLLCSYMDSRIPAHPKYPDGKTFTNQHFIRVPDKPNLADKKEHLFIYQARINTPHFKVIIDGNIRNVKEGRNNLFHAILLFLHHIKTKEHGMLRRVNLGLSGINILWVFDG